MDLRRTTSVLFNDSALKAAKDLTGWDKLGDGLEMCVYEDLIKTKEGYFGDWELI